MWTTPGQIMMSVSSHYHLILGCIKTENGPVFQNTMLGYIVGGSIPEKGHHCVFNPSSRTSHHRVVFDGSMRSRNGTSLNQVMLNGPVVQSELFDILILFRTYPLIFTCDIQKMFRNVFINEHQRGLQNILWRDSPKNPINCLQLQTVTYGLKSSTFLATRALKELANMHKDQFPLAAQAIYKNTFVDDVLTGADDVETLQELKRQIVELLKLGSFSLHKWCSNHAPVLSDIPVEHRQIDSVEIGKNDTVKTLGLTLEINSDKLSFSCPAIDEATILNTKRKILSFIGKMFDPLGIIGPVIVVAKLFMQELHSSMRKDWDSTIPNEQFLYWSKFFK
ncbi:uncharacterized protein LOC133528846 isoform X2 [Cydia pomonella]|uniref:uncharacterized protein LOC133528846 isoform X2 n=1 Tax=Cydia pomonella TaxID=82600 RepID=UPI002ADD3BA1|nr:uncharacterized protein LOC133528846 isoform X2 [Cydia pomonella]